MTTATGGGVSAENPPEKSTAAKPSSGDGTSNAGASKADAREAARWEPGPFAPIIQLLNRPLASYYLLVSVSGLLLGIGLLMVLSASGITSYQDTGNPYKEFSSQLTFAVLGVVAFLVAMRLPTRFYRFIGYPMLILSIVALVALVVAPSLGVARNGSVRWLDLGFVQFQPSEPAKLALALWGSDMLIRKWAKLGDLRHVLVPLFPVTAVLLALVGTHDLGTMLCLMIIVMTLMWVVGVRLRVFGVMVAIGVIGVIGLIKFEPYRMARIATFLNPFTEDKGDGLQAVQGLYALSTGGWLGVGLGESRGKWGYLPEAHNDFIFAVIGEELGLVGCLVIVALFCVLGYAGLRIARRTNDPFIRLATATCTMWLVGQAFINIAAVCGVVPITGIPLPLISSGGSSLVLTLFVIGVLASFARSEPEAAAALNSKGRTLSTWLLGRPPAPEVGWEAPRRRTGGGKAAAEKTRKHDLAGKAQLKKTQPEDE